MAKTRLKNHGKSKSSVKNSKKKAGNGVLDVDLVVSMGKISEIEPLEFSDEEGLQGEGRLNEGEDRHDFQPLSPNSSLKEIQRQDEARSDARNDFIHFLMASNQCNSEIRQGKNSIPPILRSKSVMHNLENSFKDTEQEFRDQVMNGGYVFFSRRPVILKPWDPNINFKKEDVKCVPIRIQREDLELKYWGQRSLFKIVGQLGKPLMEDAVTKDRERLSYARVLIEVQMDQQLPSMIDFENEYGLNISVSVKYEWKPIRCSHCSGIGHSAEECKKVVVPSKQQWVVKNDNRKTNIPDVPDADGFIKISKGPRVDRSEKQQVPPVVRMENTFHALSLEEQDGNSGVINVEYGIDKATTDGENIDNTRERSSF
uniref:DUF4283 domain-containing protein n=1 Tax=Cannabis sativa TaxID=3483 RepID=A0A803NQ60_CANSA